MAGIVNSAPIGVENLVYAVLTDESTVTYGTPALISPAINVKINPKSNSDTLYADNRAVETVSSMGEVDVEIETQDLPLEVQAILLGHTLDATSKVMSYEADDIAPYVAIGFKVKKANGKYRYVWLLKGKFSEPEEEHSTQEDKAKFQTPKLKGTFLTRADGKWKYTADEDSGFTGGATWFTKVYAPAAA
ncbi:major tail protein [Clostridium tyrobutyricum]|uniref:major tail protein n=1 Tax=Clostridium tyrobutyricum TaxID=1519 RepID=UPI0011CBBDC3|nr:major tail protein [Clostridium tyrobutyricum]